MKINPENPFTFLLIFTSLLWTSPALKAQTSYYVIKGKIIDKNTKAALQGASVFAQTTTLGEVSDTAGNFSIRLPSGGYSLVVTYTGYETETIRISQAYPEDSTLVFELRPKEKALEEVSITLSNEVKDGWQKYGQFFTENFIGQSNFAKQCIIKNAEVLHFYFSKKRNRLKVSATEPLLVENFGLGYTIRFAIDSFTNEYNTGTNLFVGYPLFEEMPGTPDQQETWAKNRAIAYKGSILQFMRSLYSRTLQEDGFELQFVVKNEDKDTSIPLEDVYGALNYSMDDSSKTVAFYPNQNEVAVIYNNAEPENAYLAQDSSARKNFQLSTLSFVPGEPIVIEQNGYYYDQENITTNGYLGFKKIADMLPYDYKTD